MMSNEPVSNAAKIIVGFAMNENSLVLHLHDRCNAVVVRLGEGRIVMDQGDGYLRLRELGLPFDRVLHCIPVVVSLGHNCLDTPVDASTLGPRTRLGRNDLFFPIGLQLMLRTSSSNRLRLVDLGTTPSPLLVARLKKIDWSMVRSADDCVVIAESAIAWANQVNHALAEYEANVEQQAKKETTAYRLQRGRSMHGLGELNWEPKFDVEGVA